MSNFKILGAQRVKALTEMLKEQEATAIAAVKASGVSSDVAETIVAKELGIEKQLNEISELRERLEILNNEIEPAIGRRYSMSSRNNYGTAYDKFNARLREVRDGDSEEKIAAIKSEYKRKEQQLWLCETLEEAKAIVGI